MIMTRSAAEFWWSLPVTEDMLNKINEINGTTLTDKEKESLLNRGNFVAPKNVSHYIKDKYNKWILVTWDDVFKKRTEKINSIIWYKRLSDTIKPCIVFVFYSPSWIMGGWYTIIRTLNNEYYLNFRIDKDTSNKYKIQMMNTFPYCIPCVENFDYWMSEFCRINKNTTYHKGRFKIQGITYAYCKIGKKGDLLEIGNKKYFKNQ
jgi:hypothetical protein